MVSLPKRRLALETWWGGRRCYVIPTQNCPNGPHQASNLTPSIIHQRPSQPTTARLRCPRLSLSLPSCQNGGIRTPGSFPGVPIGMGAVRAKPCCLVKGDQGRTVWWMVDLRACHFQLLPSLLPLTQFEPASRSVVARSSSGQQPTAGPLACELSCFIYLQCFHPSPDLQVASALLVLRSPTICSSPSSFLSFPVLHFTLQLLRLR
jgi:hypothetical protein